MRIFLVKASTACTSPIFNLKSLAGSSGRLDVIARALIASLRLRRGVRENVVFLSVLEGPPDPPKLLKVIGKEVREIPESEVDVVRIFIRLFKGEHVEGFYLEDKGFKEVVLELLSSKRVAVYYLEKMGRDIREVELPHDKDLAFILGDHIGLDSESEKFLEELKIPVISLGPKVYFTSHCITVVNEELDRREFSS